MLLRNYGDTDFITGLRAIAALMVVAVHTRAFDGLGWIGEIASDNGKYGVQIFFVISGYTVAATYLKAGAFGAYFIRRLLRIAPLYYLAILVFFALIATGVMTRPYFMQLYDGQADGYNLFAHLTFLSAWDARVANSLIGVEWTIPVEVFWYLFLPFLLVHRLTPRGFAKVFVLLLVLSGLTRAVGELWLPKHAAHFMPTTYGAYFFLGAWCHHLREKMQAEAGFAWQKWLLAGYAIFAVALVTKTGFSAALMAVATAMIIVSYRVVPGRGQLLRSRPFVLVGSVSYSIYLWHLLVVFGLIRALGGSYAALPDLVKFTVVSAVTIVVSILSYLLIERPTNALGHRVSRVFTPREAGQQGV